MSHEEERSRQLATLRAFVVNSLAARAQSAAELETKLARREADAEVRAALIDEARRLGYLDDEELAGQLARGFRSRGYGRRRAEQALRRRGLAATAEPALDAAYGGTHEASLAAAALGSRPLGDERTRRRAVAFLVRRGFAPGTAWEVVRTRAADPE